MARKSDVPECIHPYFDFRDELTVQDQLVFKGAQLLVPAAMRKMMAVAHASHIGIEGCIRRARETMFWPRMSAELKEYIAKCDICMAHRCSQGKEPIIQHEFAARPWSKVGADLWNTISGKHCLKSLADSCCIKFRYVLDLDKVAVVVTHHK